MFDMMAEVTAAQSGGGRGGQYWVNNGWSVLKIGYGVLEKTNIHPRVL
jgi:hypothetical protein